MRVSLHSVLLEWVLDWRHLKVFMLTEAEYLALLRYVNFNRL